MRLFRLSPWVGGAASAVCSAQRPVAAALCHLQDVFRQPFGDRYVLELAFYQQFAQAAFLNQFHLLRYHVGVVGVHFAQQFAGQLQRGQLCCSAN